MSDPASASQTLREQIASDLATWRELAWESSEHPGFDWAALVKAGTALAHRLASLEQQVTVVDDLPICGAECEAIADRLEAAEAQVASLEQAQQALQEYVQHKPRCERQSFRTRFGEEGGFCTCGLSEVLQRANPVTTADRAREK